MESKAPFHFKQWGHWVPAELINEEAKPRIINFSNERPVNMARVSKKLAGRILEGATWDGVPRASLVHA